MKKFAKSSAPLIERFKSALPIADLFEENVVMRMPELQKSKLAPLAKAAGFSPMGTKPMTDWYIVPAKIASSPNALAKFLKEALAQAKELPVKKTAKKSKKR